MLQERYQASLETPADTRAARRSRGRWPIVVVTAVAAAIRFSTVGLQSYWSDEGWTIRVIDQSFGGMIRSVTRTESSPHLYYILAWAWTQVFGDGEVALRSLSACFGTALVPVTYLAAQTFVSRRAAVIAAAVVAVNPLLVWFSQEARTYSLLTFLAGLSLLFFARSLRDGSARSRLWWAVASVLALASHYFSIFLVLPEALLLLRRRDQRAATVWAVGIVAVGGAALVPLALHQRAKEFGFTGIALTTRLTEVPKQFLVGFDSPAELAVALLALALAVSAWALLLRPSAASQRHAARPVAFVALAAVAIPIVLAIGGFDYLLTQNLIAAVVPLAVVVGAGCSSSRAGTVVAASLCAIGLFVVVAVAADSQYQREDWRGAASAIGEPHVDRALVVAPTEPPIFYYLHDVVPMPTRGMEVQEVDLIRLGEKARLGRFETPAQLKPPPLPSAFKLVSRRRTSKFVVARYRADRPILLTRSRLTPHGLAGWPSAGVEVFYQARRQPQAAR